MATNRAYSMAVPGHQNPNQLNMKTINHRELWFSLCFLMLFNSRLSTCFAQGSLTPPGPPGPVMKTLSQVEPRTDVLTLAGDGSDQYIITNPGSYYLTTNILGVTNQYGIEILANNVTLDLNGFSLLGAPGGTYYGITTGTVTNLTIRNGTVSGWGGAGINVASGSMNVFLEHLGVVSNGSFGILDHGSGEIRDCMVNNNGEGIALQGGGSVLNCTVSGNVDGIVTQASPPS